MISPLLLFCHHFKWLQWPILMFLSSMLPSDLLLFQAICKTLSAAAMKIILALFLANLQAIPVSSG
jgi:hypothetical protein